MTEITALGYVGVRSRNLDDWAAFGTGLLGLQIAERGPSGVSFRMDDRRHRLLVQAGDDGGPAFFGWEVADAAALEKLAARLDNRGVVVCRPARTVADQRGVADLIAFDDPAGNHLEAFHGAATAAEPFRPGRTRAVHLLEVTAP